MCCDFKFDVHIHIAAICQISKAGNGGGHRFGTAIVFMDDGLVVRKVAEEDFDFRLIFTVLLVVTVHHGNWIVLLHNLRQLRKYELVVAVKLVLYQHTFITSKHRVDNVPRSRVGHVGIEIRRNCCLS